MLLLATLGWAQSPEPDLPVMPSPLDPDPVLEVMPSPLDEAPPAAAPLDLCTAVNRAVEDRTSGFAALRGTDRPSVFGNTGTSWNANFAVTGAESVYISLASMGVETDLTIVLSTTTRGDANRAFKAANEALGSCSFTSGSFMGNAIKNGEWLTELLLPFDMLGTNKPGFETARVEISMRPGLALSGPKQWSTFVRIWDATD